MSDTAGRASAAFPEGKRVMGFISLIWGILAMLFMLVALIPLLGWLNWLVIPFAAIGAILAGIGIGIMFKGEKGRRAKAGLVLNAIVIVVALVRLGMGGGII